MTVAGCPIMLSDKLKKPLSHSMIMPTTSRKHAASTRGLRNIRRSISRDVANTIAASLVDTRLDCCNILLHGATEKSFIKLQRVQNKLARVVCNVTTRQRHTVDLSIGFPSEAALRSGSQHCATKHSASISRAICSPHCRHTCLLFCGANSLKWTFISHL